MKRFVTGPRAVLEALRSKTVSIAVIYTEDDERKLPKEMTTLAAQRQVPIEARSKVALDELTRGLRHGGMVALTGDYPYVSVDDVLTNPDQGRLVVALDEITDPHNFGAIVRSAVAFGAHGVLTLRHRACPVTPVVVRASAGATEHARIARITNLRQTLLEASEAGYLTIGLDAEGDCVLDHMAPPNGPVLLVVGSEGRGLRRLVRESCEKLARIEMSGPIASLNASVAAGIALSICHRLRARG